MHALCVKIANYLAIRTGQPEREAVLAYGLELLLGEISKFTVLFILAALLGMLPTILLVTISTVSFRLISGGNHSSSHLNCLKTTLIVLLSAGWLAKILQPWFTGNSLWWVLIIVFAYLLYAIYRWVPLSNEHRKLDTPAAKKKFRLLSFILVTLWFLSGLTLLFLLKNNPYSGLYLTSTTVGLLLQGLLVTPWGNRAIKLISA